MPGQATSTRRRGRSLKKRLSSNDEVAIISNGISLPPPFLVAPKDPQNLKNIFVSSKNAEITKKLQNRKPQKKNPDSSPSLPVPLQIKNNAPFLDILIHVNNDTFPVLALLDTGATGNFMDSSLVQSLSLHLEPCHSVSLSLIDGSPHSSGPVTHTTPHIPISVGDTQVSCSFMVSKFPSCPVILGYPFFVQINPSINWKASSLTLSRPCLVNPINTNGSLLDSTTTDEVPCGNTTRHVGTIGAIREGLDGQDLFDDDSDETEVNLSGLPPCYHDLALVFSKAAADMLPEERPFDCTIDLVNPDVALPFKPIYNLSPKELEAQRVYIKENLAKGFIRYSKSPVGFPQFFVGKKDGSLRPCVDYRDLNEVTIKDRTPLPLISDLIDRTAGARIFTKIDLRGAYNLVRIKPGHEWKTAFRTRYGLFEYLVMPFGLTNAPAIFQRMMLKIFSDMIDLFIVVYLDDILIYSSNEHEHVDHVRRVLNRLAEHKLYAKFDKCEFHTPSVEFLGFILSEGCVAMDPKKIKAVAEWPIPSTVKEIQSFLGFINFYRRFIRDFSKIAIPLVALTKKNVVFLWTNKCTDAFNELKSLVTTAPILRAVNPLLPFVLHTDASDFALGAVLSQQCPDSNSPHPVAFYSRKLLPAECNYTIHDKELLSIVASFQHWRHYLCGSPHIIDVLSDHKNLVFFKDSRFLRPRHARWNLLLSEFNFRISFCAGPLNLAADALSRRGDYLEGEDRSSNKHEITLLPPALWQSVSAIFHSDPLNIDIDLEEDWPLVIGHFLLSDQWPDIPAAILNKCKREAKHFRILNTRHLAFSRITPNGPVDYLKYSDRDNTLRRFHETLGHMGSDSILPLLKRRFWFPRMDEVVLNFVRECKVCQLNRNDSAAQPAPIRPIPPSALPFERWGIDFVGPLPTSKSGNQYILTAIDYATRWVIAQPYPNKSSRSVMHFLYNHIVMQFGPPYEIISDRDKAFLEDALPHYEQLLRIKHLPSTSYHPRTNGMVERMHQMLNHSLRCLTQDHLDRWDEFLSQVVFSIRARQHAVTKHSPFYLMFGVEPRLPCDTTPPRSTMQPLDQIELMEERHEFIARQFEDLGMARRAATERSLAQAEAMRRRDPSSSERGAHRFEIGDWVKVKIHNRTKWDRRWAGPFMIVKLSFPHTYYLMTFRGDWLNTPINEERLAPWKGTSANDVNPIEDAEVIQDLSGEEDISLEREGSLLAEQVLVDSEDSNRRQEYPDSLTHPSEIQPSAPAPPAPAPVIIRPRHLR